MDLNNVWSSMFECSKTKIGVRFQLPKVEHVLCPLDIWQTFSEHYIAMNILFQVGIQWFFTVGKPWKCMFDENDSVKSSLFSTCNW